MAIFPNEILLYITREVDNVADLAMLAGTNYFLYTVAMPLLYQMEMRNATKTGKHRVAVWAAPRGHLRVLQLLMQHGLEPKELNASRVHIKFKNEQSREDFHEFKAQNGLDKAVDKWKGIKAAPIHHAAKHGHTEVVKWLIQQGASIEEKSVGMTTTGGLLIPVASAVPYTAMTLALIFKQYTVAQVLANNQATIQISYWLEDGCSLWDQALHSDCVIPALTFASSTHRRRQLQLQGLSANESPVDTAELLIDPISALDAYSLDTARRFMRRSVFLKAVSVAREWTGRACQAWGTKGCRGEGCFGCQLFDEGRVVPYA